MKKKSYIFLVLIVAMFIIAGFFVAINRQAPDNKSRSDIILNEPTPIFIEPDAGSSEAPAASITNDSQQKINTTKTSDPLPNALSRVTKKPFGIFVSPKNSPVSPERFSGYHSAVDLETTPAEQNIDVKVLALCDGKLLSARTASGYGGVAVQSCTLDGQAVTVVYGHIRLSSVTVKVGEQLRAGDFLANLGTGFSRETDGERKHLHLGIHKGSSVNILGYVQSQSELSGWIDPIKYLN